MSYLTYSTLNLTLAWPTRCSEINSKEGLNLFNLAMTVSQQRVTDMTKSSKTEPSVGCLQLLLFLLSKKIETCHKFLPWSSSYTTLWFIKQQMLGFHCAYW